MLKIKASVDLIKKERNRMKLDLHKVFNVKGEQHFWIKYKEQSKIDECKIKGDQVWFITDDRMGPLDKLDLLDIEKVFYKKPVTLDENTKNFLKLVIKNLKYLARDETGSLFSYDEEPIKNKEMNYWEIGGGTRTYQVAEKMFNINLSFIKWEDEEPYSIKDLLEEDE